ncbi:hypothetical protein BCR37DRAFT_346526 [Protomyces lactucae-debilis]|uniref:Nop domain-containing protein n=1 Tax=Protomyces lactucae-debilis TaxID=2754530 RepID=A0A1Y2FGV3_PROLT|nr:uncharacterized protein BCR37DRAFT_346526 [Protomyces lactucae-debilis]ORY83162.1 hypothetical protein BCR37DRAFT_346526 [Protomyces lactucae-debilis]
MSDLDDLLADLADEVSEQEENDGVDEEMLVATEETTDAVDADDISHIAKLLPSDRMQSVLRQIDQYASQVDMRILGIIEQDPEYQLIVKANNISLEVDDELRLVTKWLQEHYAVRFPELEKLVLNPLDYAKCVRMIGNQEDLVPLTSKLNTIVPNATSMSIAVTATTTDGRLLTEDELRKIERACDMAIGLDAAKAKIIGYVTSRITIIAPNLSNIVGPSTAAKVVGQAGGINALARLPACNVPSIGKKQIAHVGFARSNVNQGYLYFSPLIQSVPEDVRVQAQRMVSGKLVLAARIDAGNGSPAGDKGLVFHEELEKKLEKLSEPPELKDVKALAAPDDPAKKRRGGKKVRKAKEKYAITELQKLRNRMAFGKEEAEVSYGDDTEGMGMVGSTSSIRAPTIDKRTRAKLPKAKMKGVGGMQSSLSFSSVQGIELPSLNVDALKKAQSDNKWFKSGTYTQLNQK